jgi:hypothetical protein
MLASCLTLHLDIPLKESVEVGACMRTQAHRAQSSELRASKVQEMCGVAVQPPP